MFSRVVGLILDLVGLSMLIGRPFSIEKEGYDANWKGLACFSKPLFNRKDSFAHPMSKDNCGFSMVKQKTDRASN